MIAKLYSFGVNPCIVNWNIDFLRNRWQRVKVNENCFFDGPKVPAGVRQGTRLGPWLFLAMINDLTLPEISSKMWKFADDTTVSEVVEKSMQSSLQSDNDHISMSSTTNLFQLNPIKCKEMIISFTQPPSIYEPVCMGNQLLENVTSIKSLRVDIEE